MRSHRSTLCVILLTAGIWACDRPLELGFPGNNQDTETMDANLPDSETLEGTETATLDDTNSNIDTDTETETNTENDTGTTGPT